MGYYIKYINREDVLKKYSLQITSFAELIVFGRRACVVLEKNIDNMFLDPLIRSYIVEDWSKEDAHIAGRYITKFVKENDRMESTKDKVIIDEIKEETTSYSDDSLFNITSFGTDMTFRELITMYDEGELEKPEMQRNYVWDKNEASRFIDSILLGLPVPSIFLAKTEDEKRLIVDGYQRIMTVYDFVKRGIFGGDEKSFALSNSENINQRWRGKTFHELQPEEQRKIRSSQIHAIVFEQKEPKDDTGMYQIFERINTSGRSLKPQEIRNCVYHGIFNKLLMSLNKNSAWRKIYNSVQEDSRMADIELVLRMLAFAYFSEQKEASQKQINLVKYLNVFMKRNSKLNKEKEDEFEKDFTEIMSFFSASFNMNLFRNGKLNEEEVVFSKKINPAIADAIYSATLYVKKNKGLDDYIKQDMNQNYEKLILNSAFQDAISKRTTNVENIKIRMKLAAELLYGETYEW